MKAPRKVLRTLTHGTQGGAATLTMTLGLMAVGALAALLSTAHQRLEQRTSAHLQRSTEAFEVAEAGLQWALARLNDTTPINPTLSATCAPSSGINSQAFRHWYAPSTSLADGIHRNHTPSPQARAACAMADDGALSCACPMPGDPGGASPPPAAFRRSFAVHFEDEPRDPQAVRITATACINGGHPCGDALRVQGDASARVSVLAKRMPRLHAIPNAPVTAAGFAQVCDQGSVENLDLRSGAALVHAGGAAQLGTVHRIATMPVNAQPCQATAASRWISALAGGPAAWVHAADTRLQATTHTPTAMFQAFFGQSMDQFRASACTIEGDTAAQRAAALAAAYRRLEAPCLHFWVDGDLELSNITLGALATPTQAGRPVLIASSSNLRLGDGAQVNGVLFAQGTLAQIEGLGTSVNGAVVARGGIRIAGQSAVRFDLGALSDLAASGPFLRVPGSWIDERVEP